MRKSKLLTATALVVVMTGSASLALGSGALADTTISTATTTPVATSTSANVTVSSAGSITLTSGTAITVDSNNTVELDGNIVMSSSAPNSTGILINGGQTSGLNVTANITVTDNFTATDTSSPTDGIVDGPFSDGATRYGIHSLGAAPFVGNVAVTNASTIEVKGDNSYGIRFENNINGTVSLAGTISQEGNNNTAISLENGVTGNVHLSGTVKTQGQNSEAVNLAGNFGGSLIIDGSYTGTGYATTGTQTATVLAGILKNPNDMYQSGPLIAISGNVANGILLDAPPVNDSTNTSTDQNGDGLVDANQTTASLITYGSAPALLIGSAANDVNVGAVITQVSATAAPTAPAVNYGLLIRGTVNAYSTYSGIDSVGIQLGAKTGGHLVNIANGIGVSGTVGSTTFGGNALGLSILSGTSTPRLDVTGTLHGVATSATTSDGATVPTYSTVTAAANAVTIASGASLPAINIGLGGTIAAVATGSTDHATAILDQSNTLTSINNLNILSSTITQSDDNGDGVLDSLQNRPIAIDAHTNTVGLTLTQSATTTTSSSGTTTTTTPYIQGDILLGSGNDAISSSGGSIYGNIDFGGGANSFTLTNGALFLGKMTGSGTVALDISNGTAGLAAGSSLNVTTLHVGSTGALVINLATATPNTPVLVGSGAAVFDSGAKLELSTDKIVTLPTTFKVLTASSINLGALATASTEGLVPYIYEVALSTSAGNTELDGSFRLKTQAEAGYSNNQYAALAPVLNAVSNDDGATAALLTQTTKAGFDKIFNQYLPDYSGENLITLSLGSESLNRTLGTLTLVPSNDGGQYWMQEYGYKTTRKYGETAGFNSTGFSFAAGRETAVYGNQMIGYYMSYSSASPLDSFAIAKENMVDSDATFGAYWRLNTNGFRGWAHAGAGYTSFRTTRELLTPTVTHIATASWNGGSSSAGLGASYDYRAGVINITPQVFADYYNLSENKHSEKGGGDYFDLNIAKRDGHVLSTTALVNVSYNRSFIKPEVWIGYKDNISSTIADTVVNFNNSTPFTLSGGNLKGGGMIAGFRLSADNPYSYFSLEGDYEKQAVYTNVSISLRSRFQF